MQKDGGLFTLCFERRVDCRAGVDDDHISPTQKIREIEEASVRNGVITDSRHHQSHLITRESTYFGWLVSRVLVGELEVEAYVERVHAASAADGPSVAAE